MIGKEGTAQRRAWLEVDPDEIKKDLLDAALEDGSYESFIKPPAVHELEEQGERFYPLDFAALVHEESSALAKSIRGEAIRSGANVVIDSVLSKPEAAVALGRQLKEAGYSVEVLDVEVPVEVSRRVSTAVSSVGRVSHVYTAVIGRLSSAAASRRGT